MALSKDSIRKLRAVKAAILAEPELYDQTEFPRVGMRHNCDTPCCIAGWSVWINNPDRKAYDKFLSSNSIGSQAMADALGVTHAQAHRLFSEWPKSGSPAWENPRTKVAARDGARHIELFIKGGGDWPEAA